MSSANDPLGLLLHDAARALRRRFDRRASTLGLSTAQWRLLLKVFHEGHSTQARLADQLEIEPISVSRLIDRMVQAGWIAREADPADRRAHRIVATQQSLAVRPEMRRMADEVYAEALAGIGNDDLATLLTGLTTIISNLSAADEADAASEPKKASA